MHLLFLPAELLLLETDALGGKFLGENGGVANVRVSH